MSRVEWDYEPGPQLGMGLVWSATFYGDDGRITSASGLARSPRRARRAIRQALRRARKARA